MDSEPALLIRVKGTGTTTHGANSSLSFYTGREDTVASQHADEM